MKINFQLPDRVEWAFFLVAGLTLIIFDWTQNMFQSNQNLNYLLWGFIPAIVLFWITFIGYHIFLFIAYARAIKRRQTHYFYDWIAGVFAFAGMFGFLVGGIGAMYFAPEQGLPYFFNIAQIDVWHFGGILVEILVLTYFIVTE
jgi:hypothetical protein